MRLDRLPLDACVTASTSFRIIIQFFCFFLIAFRYSSLTGPITSKWSRWFNKLRCSPSSVKSFEISRIYCLRERKRNLRKRIKVCWKTSWCIRLQFERRSQNSSRLCFFVSLMSYPRRSSMFSITFSLFYSRKDISFIRKSKATTFSSKIFDIFLYNLNIDWIINTLEFNENKYVTRIFFFNSKVYIIQSIVDIFNSYI